MDKKLIGITAGVLVLMGAAAAVASYSTRQSLEAKPVVTAEHPHKVVRHTQQLASSEPVHQAQPAQPACNDRNIVGTAAGAVGGGLVGSQIGKGAGNTAAIIGGVVGGGLLGNEYIPTRNVTCR